MGQFETMRLTRRSMIAVSLAAFTVRPAAAGQWRYPQPVGISAEDIAWFRHARSTWIDCESGAPAIIPDGMDEAAYWDAFDSPASTALARLEKVMCAFFLHARFGPGPYTLAKPMNGRSSFEVTTEHIKLLQTTNWRSSTVDCKRPYGDFVHFEIDMARALDVPVTQSSEGYDEIGEEAEARMDALHQEMLFVLQCYLENATMVPGNWLIPYDGWESIILPRCEPVTGQKMDAYKVAMAEIALRGIVQSEYDLVIPKLKASADLFSI